MSDKIIHYSSYILFALIHLIFVLRIALRKSLSWEQFFLLTGIVIALVLSYKRFLSHHKESTKGNYKEILAVLIGAVATYYLAHVSFMNAITASCVVGLLASFIPNIFPEVEDIRDFPPAVYCGSFVGMSSEMVVGNIWLLVNAGLVSGFIFSYSKSTLYGFGGKLGTIAFVGVLIVITIYAMMG